MNEKRIEKIAANITAAAKVVVYDIPNGFASNAEWMYKWLRHEGLNPSWGDMSDGSLRIELPQDEVSALQELQKENPARFGNWRKYESSSRIAAASLDGPEPKFKVGDQVKTYSPKFTEVWSVGQYDEHLGDRRYQIIDPDTRAKLWMNEKNIKKAAFRDEDDEDEVVVCSACGSEQLESQCLLGGLGNRKHYRCRHCGITWSETVKASDGKPWKVMEITKNFYGRPLSDEIVAEFSTEAQARSYARKLEEKQEAEYSNIEEGSGGKVGISTFHVNYEASSKKASSYPSNYFSNPAARNWAGPHWGLADIENDDLTGFGLAAKMQEIQESEGSVDAYIYDDAKERMLEDGVKMPSNIRRASSKKASIVERIARSFFANKFQRGDIVYLQRNGKATKTKIVEKHFNGGKWAYTVEGEDSPVVEAELDFKA